MVWGLLVNVYKGKDFFATEQKLKTKHKMS